MFVHHTNKEDALADARRLVCYDCGVACDMTKMRTERVDFLERLGAEKRSLPVVREAPAPAPDEPAERQPQRPAALDSHTIRLFFEKTGPMALLGHLDLIRELPRVFRRVGLEVAYTRGFHPKPDMSFGPALSLGVLSLEEAIDVKVTSRLDAEALASLPARMTACAPEGLGFFRAERVPPGSPRISAVVGGARYAIVLARIAARDVAGTDDVDAWLAERVRSVLAADSVRVRREVKGLAKMVDVRSYLRSVSPLDAAGLAAVRRAGLVGDLVGFDAVAEIRGDGAAKPSEIAEVLLGASVPTQLVRVALVLGAPGPSVEAFGTLPTA
jgi:radical SAM-linked protein